MSTSVNLTTSMSSILNSLKSTTKTMDKTNSILSSGLKVQSALDDPIAYFAADDHTDQANSLALLDNDMSEAKQTITAASEGLASIKDLLDQAKALCNSALSADTDSEVTSYMNQVNDILSDIDEVANNSDYSGVNLLGGASVSMTVHFDSDTSTGSSITVSGIDGSADGLNAGLVGQSGWTTASDSTIQSLVTAITAAKTTVRSDTATLSAKLSVVSTRQELGSKMQDVLKTGAAKLTNADTNEESANLLALQTQQQLGVSSLSIASQSQQAVLKLF
jgi:flagellin